MKRAVPYGTANYEEIVAENLYFVDKTAYIERLERIKDTKQINSYAAGLRQEYPEAQIAQFVIYCIGNKGFRVFPVPFE